MLRTVSLLLRGINIANWAIGLLFFVGALTVGFGFPQLFRDAAERAGIGAPAALLDWLRLSGLLMLPMTVAVHIICTRLVAIVDGSSDGAAFSPANAARLRTIAWALLATQVIDLAWGVASQAASAASGEYLGWSLGLTGWIAVLLLFVLARIFQHGAAMREELDATV